MVRFAFTLIELIFAIVIIGITVISLPMMTQATSKGIEKSIVQEAVFAAAAELNQAVTYFWDKNSMDTADSLSKVINIGGAECNATTKLRPGHIISQPLHRRCSAITLVANAPDTNITNLNNAAGGPTRIYVESGSTTPGGIFDSTGYKQDYNSTVIVNQNVRFNGAAYNPNMKRITVTITNGTDTITKLITYSANIGEVDYYKRSW